MKNTLLAALLILISQVAPAAEVHLLHTPCRVLDTRNTSVGFLAANTQLDIRVREGATGQGGTAGCELPPMAEGAIVNLVAVAPASAGHVALWAAGESQPSTSAINFTSSETTNDGLTVRLADWGFPYDPPAYDLSLKAIAGAYWVMDLVAWIGAADGSAVRGEVVDVQSTVLPGQSSPISVALAFEGWTRPFVCQKPWIDPEMCEMVTTGVVLSVTGHWGANYSYSPLMLHTLVEEPADPCPTSITTYDLRYSESTSEIWVPGTSATDLAPFGPAGKSIVLGGSASQPGEYLIANVSSDGRRLVVYPTPQTATDQSLAVTIASSNCTP